jgi:guanosine-3',5'-bis(diphosphate) 3'-pyrophosphohydrolase
MDELLEKIQAFAAQYHNGQTRKYSSESYIHHLIRVKDMLTAYTQDETILAAALLHDIIEDTPVTREDLKKFLTSITEEEKAVRISNLVDELTDVYVKDKYPQWNRRKRKAMELKRLEKTSAASQTVKYADIIDNCRLIVKDDPEFAGTFLNECLTLLKKINKGDPLLYNKAKERVEGELRKLKQGRKFI